MRNPNRIPRLMRKIEKFWMRYPDLRLCQMLIGLRIAQDSNLFMMEDDVTERILDRAIAELKKK